MNKLGVFFCSLILFLLATPPAGNAQGEVSVELFYNALEPSGEWLETEDYGYVWHPADVAEDWRPYTEGHWVFTDAGWTWVSEEPWAWATYHYGRWADVEEVGWVWVPDTEWAPAWVSWRSSDTHVGWAPLPPEARWRENVGFKGWVDSYYDIGPASYSFVEVRNLGAPSLRKVIVEPRENVTIITKTKNITNITYTNKVVFLGGPDYEVITKRSEQPIPRLKLDRRTDITVNVQAGSPGQFVTKIQGDRVQFAAPVIKATTVATVAPRKVGRKVEAIKINRGWRVADGDDAAIQKVRVQMKSEAKAPAELPPQPRFERAGAKSADPSPAAGAKPGNVGAGAKAAPPQPVTGTAPAPVDAKENEKVRKNRPAAAAGTPGQPGNKGESSEEMPADPASPTAVPKDPAPKAPGAPAPGQPEKAGKKAGGEGTKTDATPEPAPTTSPSSTVPQEKSGKQGKGRAKKGDENAPPTSTSDPAATSDPAKEKKAKGKRADQAEPPATAQPMPDESTSGDENEDTAPPPAPKGGGGKKPGASGKKPAGGPAIAPDAAGGSSGAADPAAASTGGGRRPKGGESRPATGAPGDTTSPTAADGAPKGEGGKSGKGDGKAKKKKKSAGPEDTEDAPAPQ